MAPIPCRRRKDQEAVVNMPPILVMDCFKPACFEEESLKAEQKSRFTRCSSLSSEEESIELHAEHIRSLVSVKTSFTLNSTDTLNKGLNWLNTGLNNWPGVSCGLDEDERRKKAKSIKSKVALELELEKKTAVENDDSSTSENFGSFAWFEDEKYTIKTRSQIQLKNEKCELKTEECFVNDGPLVVPYSVQETHSQTEGVEHQPEKILLQVQVPPPPPSSSELLLKEDPVSSGDKDCAHSYVEEINLEDDKSIETKHKSLFRRHAVKKVKRSIWCITEPEPPVVLPKRKKTCKTVRTVKQRQARGCVRNQTVPEVSKRDESNILKIVQQSSKRASKRKVPNSPARGEPKDSGVYSNSAGSACGGSSSGSGSGSGSFSAGSGSGSAGGSGADGSGGGDDNGDDGEKGKKYPWWHLPGGGKLPAPDSEKEKKKEDSRGQEKMKVDMSGFQNFLPSKVDNPEQCHGPGWKGVATPNQKLVFFSQDIQHASYCSKADCPNMKCKLMKAEIMHMQAHKGWNQLCTQCMNTYSVVQQHAKYCSRAGCRVPECDNARSGTNAKKNLGQPVQPFQPQRVPVQVPRQNVWVSSRTLYCTPLMEPSVQVDGRVIFRNSSLLPGDYFSEHVDYNKMTRDKLGDGSNGDIYPVYLPSDRSLKMVVKETKYPIPREEVEVYKLLGDHEHIVKHYGGTFRGSEGKASIFMEKCDECLYSYMKKLGRRLSVEEAMFYWIQIVDGVYYLHNLPTPVIHKDIKAKNVLLTEEYSRVKLTDFDSAKRLTDEFTEAGLKPLGTRGFVSPEVWERKPHGRPADVYSLGCFLIELTVDVPSPDTLWQKINMLCKLDPELAQLVEECVQECPEDRPTARALLEKPVVKKYTRS